MGIIPSAVQRIYLYILGVGQMESHDERRQAMESLLRQGKVTETFK